MTEGTVSAPPRFRHRLLQRTDIAWLAAFRILLGTTLAVSMLRFLAYGWVERFFVSPGFHFTYWGLSWVKPLPAAGMHALFWALTACAVLVALGLWFRIAAWVFAVGFAYVQAIDVTTYLNHYYLAALLSFLLASSPAGRAWSLDCWLRARRVSRLAVTDSASGSLRSGRAGVSFVWLLLFRVQVGVVYTFAGLAKLQSDWLLFAQPLSIWLGSRTEIPVIGRLFTVDGVPLLMSWAGFVFDSLIIWFLLWRKTRLVAYTAVIGFHATTRALFPIGMFSVIMVVSALVFFPPDWPRALLQRWRRNKPVLQSPSAVAPGGADPGCASWGSPQTQSIGFDWQQRLGLALAGLYCAVQLLLPLRFLAYGENVLWHEQGMRFSWRVMVREKNASVTFLVRDPTTERQFTVSPRAYLTQLQEKEMSTQPDLILQLAQHVARDFNTRLGRPVQVRVEALVSLNGRRMAPLIDSQVNLADVRDSLAPFPWVLPAPDEPPPKTRPI